MSHIFRRFRRINFLNLQVFHPFFIIKWLFSIWLVNLTLFLNQIYIVWLSPAYDIFIWLKNWSCKYYIFSIALNSRWRDIFGTLIWIKLGANVVRWNIFALGSHNSWNKIVRTDIKNSLIAFSLRLCVSVRGHTFINNEIHLFFIHTSIIGLNLIYLWLN